MESLHYKVLLLVDPECEESMCLSLQQKELRIHQALYALWFKPRKYSGTVDTLLSYNY